VPHCATQCASVHDELKRKRESPPRRGSVGYTDCDTMLMNCRLLSRMRKTGNFISSSGSAMRKRLSSHSTPSVYSPSPKPISDLFYQDEIKAAQPRFEPTLVKLSTGVAPFPQPGRPLRNLVARSLVLLYTKGDTKTIYDVLQTYIRVAGDFKATDNDSAKTYVC
jgi:hypothetical protein